jgi:hypothetical protein
VERPRILAYLAEHPGQTAYEVAAALGYGKPESSTIASIIRRMWRQGVLVHDMGLRPNTGQEARLWRVAPPGTPPPPCEMSRAAAERRRALNRMNKRRQRARAAWLHVDRGAQLHSRPAAPSGPAVWQLPAGAACRDADTRLFFPEPGEDDWEAKQICAACPIRVQCLALAITNGEEFGIWGGVNLETERLQPIESSIASRCRPGLAAKYPDLIAPVRAAPGDGQALRDRERGRRPADQPRNAVRLRVRPDRALPSQGRTHHER